MSVTVTGSDKVLDYSDYTFTFTTGANTIGLADYIAFEFPDGFIYNMAGFEGGRSTQCSLPALFCAKVYVFGVSNMIYLSPSAPVSAGTTITLTLKDVPNPDYVINGNNNY